MAEKDYERLGDYITARRLDRGMDRKILAEEAGITYRTLSDIESGNLGDRKDFSQETMEAIGLAIGWLPGTWRTVLKGGQPELVPESVGPADEDAFVASPGERTESGVSDDEVLRRLDDMQRRIEELSERLEKPGQ